MHAVGEFVSPSTNRDPRPGIINFIGCRRRSYRGREEAFRNSRLTFARGRDSGGGERGGGGGGRGGLWERPG